MSSTNFEYLRESAPALAELGAFAEQYLKSDPDSALTKLRGFCEASVKLLYQHQGWSVPERFTLDQLIRESEFTDAYPKSVLLKLDYLRVHGNKGAHNASASSADALAVLREAHRIGQFLYLEVLAGEETRISDFIEPSGTSKTGETGQARLKRDANINAMMSLLSKEASQPKKASNRSDIRGESDGTPAFLLNPADPNYRAAGEQRPAADSISVPEAVIKTSGVHANRRGQDAADRLGFNEEETRKQLIDVQLAKAGWAVSDDEEVVVERPVEHQPTQTGMGYIDYVLKQRESGKILAVVEAKRCAKDPADGKAQARLYADGIEKETGAKPVIFYTNGYETWMWDDHATSQSPPRKVHGFYSQQSLEYLIWRRTEAAKLSSITPGQKFWAIEISSTSL